MVLQKPQGQDNRLPPSHTLIMDFTMTHVRFGRSHFHPIGQVTNTRRSDGTPDPHGDLKKENRIKIHHYRRIYLNRPVNELSEESDQFRFLRAPCLDNRKGSVGWILVKSSKHRT